MFVLIFHWKKGATSFLTAVHFLIRPLYTGFSNFSSKWHENQQTNKQMLFKVFPEHFMLEAPRTTIQS